MPPDRQRPDRSPRKSSWRRAKWRLSLAVASNTIQVTEQFSSISSQFSGRTPGVVRGLPTLFPFHQPHKRTCGSTAIYSTHMPRRHYTFTNIHVFSGARTQALWHSSQRR
ncbi:hypothetical protein TNCV_3680801 [Trichonephila clavipes]|nr:hypothetical protein TNCV_3680801 [Trichonephila clavipes]